jgi:hypothetical protein
MYPTWRFLLGNLLLLDAPIHDKDEDDIFDLKQNPLKGHVTKNPLQAPKYDLLEKEKLIG